MLQVLDFEETQPRVVDPDNFGPNLRRLFNRRAILRAQPLDAGYTAWILAVRAFVEECERYVLEAYDDEW
ncbi:hypothetical protein CHU98_g10389 [Xylaria longipes]|nr:hypothetical protein CHU98_g10389 [Xylaria longipes]